MNNKTNKQTNKQTKQAFNKINSKSLVIYESKNLVIYEKENNLVLKEPKAYNVGGISSSISSSLERSTEFLDILDPFLMKEKKDQLKLGTISINEQELVLSVTQIKEFLFKVERLIWGLRFITRENYINKSINIPCVNKLLKILLGKDVSSRYYDVKVNVLYYNLFLVLLLEIINKMITFVLNEKELNEDLYSDLFNQYKIVYYKLNPHVRDQLSSKGITVVLNTFTGFDSEYQLESSIKMKNSLLSIQLASNTNSYVRVPKSITNIRVKSNLLCESNIKDKYGIKGIIESGERSLDILLSRMRLIHYKEKDEFISRLHNRMSSISTGVSEKDDYKIYSFPNTSVETMIKYASTDIQNGSYSSTDLMKDSIALKNYEHEKFLLWIINDINTLGSENPISDKIRNRIKECTNKPSSRFNLVLKNDLSLSITISKVLYIGMHESTADLSMLSDFDIFKESLDIVQRSFVTLGKPLIIEGITSKVYIRDTILIAPIGAKSLAKIGGIYGKNYNKIDIGHYRGEMLSLLKEDKELFSKYAIRDAEITLKHLNEMESFNFRSTGRIGVPLTMSGIGKAFVMKRWAEEGYKGYLGENGVKLGNFAKVLTPKIARSLSVSRFLVPYITGYRGGRNESFMYGIEEIINGSHIWYDYDLTSAYTTVMCLLGHPDITEAKRIFNKTVSVMDDVQFLFNYIILEVEFEFKADTKFPSLPVVSGDLEIYPLKGSTVITGPEYLVAKNMGCKIYVKDGVMIPFADRKYKVKDVKPFMKKYPLLGKIAPYRSLINYLQEQRRIYPKKTFYNFMYKEIGNSIYGQVAMGLGNKTSFDVKTKSYVHVEGGDLSSPILSSYITGFTRAIIGECLNNIQSLKGRVISVTTDGFITDVPDLEHKILTEIKEENRICLELYKCIRRILTTTTNKETGKEMFDDSGLEIKHEEKLGIVSLKTRCQYGYTEGGISAATGFQTKFYNNDFIIKEITKRLDNSELDNTIEFVQTGLRSASDVYKQGGNVIAKYSDRLFSFSYDNKRCIIENKENKENKKLFDSKPWASVSEFESIRTLTDTVSKTIHKQNSFYTTGGSKSYKSYLETGVRGFIKVCFNTEKDPNNPLLNIYGISSGIFENYQSLIEFIYGYEPAQEVKLSVSSISKLKLRNTISRAVPRTKENELFINYIKEHIDTFNSELFFRELSTEKIRLLKSQKKEKKLKVDLQEFKQDIKEEEVLAEKKNIIPEKDVAKLIDVNEVNEINEFNEVNDISSVKEEFQKEPGRFKYTVNAEIRTGTEDWKRKTSKPTIEKLFELGYIGGYSPQYWNDRDPSELTSYSHIGPFLSSLISEKEYETMNPVLRDYYKQINFPVDLYYQDIVPNGKYWKSEDKLYKTINSGYYHKLGVLESV